VADIVSALPAAPASGGNWRRATAWLAALAAFFYLSYGFANWLASQRSHVPSIVFAWENDIPFVAWTIIPYWSTNLLYALSFYLCRDRSELDSHARRLLTAQSVAVACFLLFPLRVSLTPPITTGLPGLLFAALGSFDKPFNQAPSLHIAITTILFAVYVQRLPRWAARLFAAWSLLVATSVLTTYQHHFIDVPTGLLLGLISVWMWPTDGSSRLAHWRFSRDPRRRSLARAYALAAAALLTIACLVQGGALWLTWPALSLGAVSLAYLGLGQALFAKRADGRIEWPTRFVLAPYLLAAWINSRLWTLSEPRRVQIVDGVWLGRFPSAADCQGVASVVDLACEFSRPAFVGTWTCVPMLDLVAPDVTALRAAADAIERARTTGPTLVCCALGYGRSAAALAVWLVRTRRQADLPSALRYLRIRRPRLALTAPQRSAIAEAIDAV
jgi:membrane-associated phospholipid phosphatase